MCLGWMFFNTVFYGLLTWMPNYLYKVHGFDIKQMGGASLHHLLRRLRRRAGRRLDRSDIWKARGGSPNTVFRTLFGIAAIIATVSIFLGRLCRRTRSSSSSLLSTTLFFLRWCGMYWVHPVDPRRHASAPASWAAA